MGEYEDWLQEMRDAGYEDGLIEKGQKFTNSEMRQRIGNTAAVEKERDELKAEIAKMKAAPKRAEALKAAGVDLAALQENPAALEAIERSEIAEGKEYDEEWAKGLVQRYKLPVTEGTGEEGEQPAAQGMSQPGGPVGTSKPAGKVSLTPLEVNSWPAGKRMRFIEHLDKIGRPEVFEQLLRGETVTGITFS